MRGTWREEIMTDVETDMPVKTADMESMNHRIRVPIESTVIRNVAGDSALTECGDAVKDVILGGPGRSPA